MQSVQLIYFPKYSRFLSQTTRINFYDIFSKENSLKCVNSFKALCPQFKIDGKRQAAVLIPLCVVNNEVSILYTLRTNKLKRNSGQVSFPGGMREANEQLWDTALRESCEELGLTDTSVDIWGSGRFIVSRDVAIMPFLGNIGVVEPDKLNINHEEVQQQPNKLVVIPVYMNNYKRIWGMTAYMTWMALRSIIPKQFTHKITSTLHTLK